MARNPVGFEVTDPVAGWNESDFDDIFIRKDCFLEGGLWVWGCGASGGLGTNDTISRSSPVQTISGGTNWRELSSRGGIKTDGTLWVWGGNYAGRLGTGDAIFRSSPVQTISGGTNWKKLEVTADGSQFGWTSGIKTDGTLWVWGCNSFGQLGDNTIIHRSSPVQTFTGGTNWKSISGSSTHAIALKTDGTLWTWGCGVFGQLGDNLSGSTANKSSPVQTFSAGTNWKSISTAGNHSGGIKTDGSLWLWGANINGQLGDNTVINRSSPIQTNSMGTNWKQVSVGSSVTAGIKTDGTLWTWGQNGNGILGTYAPFTSRSSPIQAFSGGTNWRCVNILGGALYTFAGGLKTDGTLWMWGCGVAGRLGNNSLIDRSSPVQTISGGTNWKSIKLDSVRNVAIREDCW